jgi:hypothetical protein
MDIVQTPETYTPQMNMDSKQYLDHNICTFTYGIICPCTPTKTFYKKDLFTSHQKTKKHQKWIQHLNDNAINYYKEVLELKQTVKTQQVLLTDIETKLQQRQTIIDYLEERNKQLTQNLKSYTETGLPATDLMTFVDP